MQDFIIIPHITDFGINFISALSIFAITFLAVNLSLVYNI